MPLDYGYLKGLPPLVIDHRFTRRDTMLYALGIGAGLTIDGDGHELRYVYEPDLVALPTMAVTLGYPGFWSREPKYGITWQKLLHVEQSIEIHAQLPVEGHVRGVMRIDEIYDRGAEKGALMHISRRIVDAATDQCFATVRQVNLLRADGGFGGPELPAQKPSGPPDTPPDEVLALPTRIDQALIYRLSGDHNPLHADPAIARGAGFDRPILHGLATFGIVGRALISTLCANDPSRVRRLDARFSSPVYPGETIETRIWRTGTGHAAVEAFVVERGIAVIRNAHIAFQD